MNLNKAMIIGNLTRDPEMRQTPNGKSVVSFAVATNRVWVSAAGAKQEEVEYHNIVAWGKLAEICNQYLKKGRKAYVEGRLKTRDWVGKDGVKHVRTEIIAENMIILDKAPGQGNYSPSPPVAASAPRQEQEEAPAIISDEDIKVEDIPF
ncbi:MAG: single-stranded DNA-binding protein [Patescibacteria group bacterium]